MAHLYLVGLFVAVSTLWLFYKLCIGVGAFWKVCSWLPP